MKIAFIDRDGTVSKSYPDPEWKGRTQPEILDGALVGLKMLRKRGYRIIILTNQDIINQGIISRDEYAEFTKNLLKIFELGNIEIVDIFYCPHLQAENCNCKKPKRGMVDFALKKYSNINLQQSIYIGDSLADFQLAHTIGVAFFGIKGGNLPTEKATYESIMEIERDL